MFENLKIVELASVLAGPTVGSFFAELGAEVIKVENPVSGGDVTRHWKLEEEAEGNSISAYYAAANYGKEVTFLNLKQDEQLKELYHLIETADIVLTNYKKGDAEKLNVSYRHLKKVNDQIIYGKITGFGNEDQRVGYDLIVQAESGFMAMNGTPESGPVKMPVALMDLTAAHQLKEGLLCALFKREKEGTGCLVSVSLYDAALSSLANQASNYLMAGHIPQPSGSLHPNIAPYGKTFKTKDGKQLVLAIASDRQFNQLCRLLDLEDLTDDARFDTNQKRVQNRGLLADHLQKAILAVPSSTFKDWIYKYNLPLGFIKNMEEVMKNPKAQQCVLEEIVDEEVTKRLKNVAFQITNE